jgi:hypothetical protein
MHFWLRREIRVELVPEQLPARIPHVDQGFVAAWMPER